MIIEHLLLAQDYLLKQLLIYGLLHSQDQLESIKSVYLKDNEHISDEEIAEIAVDGLFKVTPNMELMSYPEATIMVISEHYGAAKRNGVSDLKTILVECDKQRCTNVLDLLEDNEINLENYIIKMIEVQDMNNVFEKLDKEILRKQIKIAKEFQFDSSARINAFFIEGKKSNG